MAQVTSRNTSRNAGDSTVTQGSRRRALIDPAHFLIATRDTGYRTTALAAAELIDNALQARASRVDVDVVSTEDKEFPIEIRVTDNGIGMDEQALGRALVFGGSSRFNDRSSLGRYGMGLPNGALSRARRVETYTWRDGEVLVSYLDVDEIASKRRGTLPPVVSVERPAFVPATDSGTTVRLLRCDRLEYRRAATLRRKLLEDLGRIYRTFIGDGFGLFINSSPVHAVDPLFLDRASRKAGARQFGDVLHYRLAGRSGFGDIEVRFSELPIESWHVLSAADKRRRGIANAPTVSVLRAGREIDRGWLFMGSKRRENYDDWWRCEIRFDPVLDELFGITHSKQAITPTQELMEALVPDIEHIARALNGRVRERFERIKVSAPLSAAEQQAGRADVHLPRLPQRDGRLAPEVEEVLSTVAVAESDGSPYHLAVSELPSTAAFEAAVRKGRLVVVLNSHHPLYRDLYGPLAASDVKADQETATRLALTVLAAARAGYLGSGRADREGARRFRRAWSDVLATFMNG